MKMMFVLCLFFVCVSFVSATFGVSPGSYVVDFEPGLSESFEFCSQDYGGEIELYTEDGQGSKFEFAFPILKRKNRGKK